MIGNRKPGNGRPADVSRDYICVDIFLYEALQVFVLFYIIK